MLTSLFLVRVHNRLCPFSSLRFLALCIPFLVLSIAGITQAATIARSVWNLPALGKPPQVHPSTDRPAAGMRSLFYEGADYKGKPTWVFAYYAAPKGDPPAGGWPAVVCAHGGGDSDCKPVVLASSSEQLSPFARHLGTKGAR